MAEVTSGKDLTVVVLDQREIDELAGLLHEYYFDVLKADETGWPLQELYDALVPTDEED